MRYTGLALLLMTITLPGLRPVLRAQDEAPAPGPFPENDLPPVLQPWVKWARDGAPLRDCPAANGEAVCAWPGALALELTGTGGRFTQRIHAERKLEFGLPGDAARWPQGVTLDGKAAAVIMQDEKPVIHVEPGDHLIAGQFTWGKLPDTLAIPAETALVSLTVNGRAVAYPARDEEGLLTLHGAEMTPGAEGDAARLKIFRRLSDGIPLWLETEFRFEIAGRARELRLPGALYPGATAVSVAGELPARLDSDGTLRVQVRPGRFSVMVRARLAMTTADKSARQEFKAPAPAIQAKQNGLDYPEQEYWTFARNESLRAVNISGPTEVDAVRVEMAAAWRGGPAFALSPGEALVLSESHRGAPDAAPDQLAVRREWWLDEDGHGFTVRDHLTGTLNRTSRLEMLAPAKLGRASVDGQAELVTGDAAHAGVEVRRQALNLEADARIDSRPGKLPAVGWNSEATSLSTQVHLPPGWRLLHAFGPNHAEGSWFSGWSLWAFFFILVMTAAVWKLTGWRWGLVAFGALGLCHHEAGAPVITWVSLLLATALLRVLPEHWFKTLIKLWWGVSVLVLIFLLLPFYLDQVRMALYPQLHPYAESHGIWPFNQREEMYSMIEQPAPVDDLSRFGDKAPASPNPTSPTPPPSAQNVPGRSDAPLAKGKMERRRAPKKNSQEQKPDQSVEEKDEEVGSLDATPESPAVAPSAAGRLSNLLVIQSGSPSAQAVQALQQDPHAVIQTGAGIPNWRWATVSLSWSGPVPQKQTFRLLLIPRWLNFILNFMRIALTAGLAYALLRLVGKRGIPEMKAMKPAAPLALLFAFAFLPGALNAQGKAAAPAGNGAIPSPEILRELHDRLVRGIPAPVCGDHCAETASARITLANGKLTVSAEVHAGAVAAWPVPGPLAAWTPASITVDGKPASALVRRDDGVIYLKLEAGIHKVEAAGPAPPKDAFSLQFSLPPHRASVDAPGWQVDGIRPEGGIESALQFTRRLAPANGASAAAGNGGGYAPWLEVERILSIGVTWQVETIIRRVSPPGTPVVARIPLLKGMLVTGATPVEGETVLVTLGAEEMESHFSATLAPVENQPVTINAPAAGGISTEIWTVICGPVWRCEASGLPPVSRWANGVQTLRFRPWPEEKLTLLFSKPKGLDGATLTVDKVRLELTPGEMIDDAVLYMQVRSSRAGTLMLTPPAGAEIISLKVNGVAKPAQMHEGALNLELEAGNQPVALSWRQAGGMKIFYQAPEVKLGTGGAVNSEIQIHLPSDRWLLFTYGPDWGPAVLFWGIFIVVLIAAAALGRVPHSPLSSLQWALLAAGLTQVWLGVGLIVVFWFLAMRMRALKPAPGRWRFNLAQIGLAFWTVAFLICLGVAVYHGLVLHPDMQVAGAGSSGDFLRWYQDRISGSLPRPAVISLPYAVYQGLMFVWALWLALRLVRWLKNGWNDFSSGGMWKAAPPKLPPPLPPLPPTMPDARDIPKETP